MHPVCGASGYENVYQGVLATWKIELIRRLASSKGFKPQDLPDIEQEIAWELVLLARRYPKLPLDQEKALVTRSIHFSLLNIRNSASYRRWRKMRSLDAIKGCGAPGPVDPCLPLQVAEFLEGLPQRDKRVCQELMKGASGQEIAALLGIREESVCRIKRRLRVIARRFFSYRGTGIG